LIADGASGRNALISSYGAALIDRALLDALCCPSAFAQRAIQANLPGIDATSPDIAGTTWTGSSRACATRDDRARHMSASLSHRRRRRDDAQRRPAGRSKKRRRLGNRYFKLRCPATRRRTPRAYRGSPPYSIDCRAMRSRSVTIVRGRRGGGGVLASRRRFAELARLYASTLISSSRCHAIGLDAIAVLGRRMPS
jgi:hypothetical protein